MSYLVDTNVLSELRRKQPDDNVVRWLEVKLPRYFRGRLLAVDDAVADRWGRLMAQAGRGLPAIDSLLAATALTHGLALVTRNERDFRHPNLEVINPWTG